MSMVELAAASAGSGSCERVTAPEPGGERGFAPVPTRRSPSPARSWRARAHTASVCSRNRFGAGPSGVEAPSGDSANDEHLPRLAPHAVSDAQQIGPMREARVPGPTAEASQRVAIGEDELAEPAERLDPLPLVA